MKKALLLFSGGQDSATALAWSLKKFDQVYLISFDYGQRHIIEIKSSYKIIKKINKSFNWKGKIISSYTHKIKNINKFNSNALTSNLNITNKKNKLPNTFVPGRNLLFYTLASAYAYDKKINNIVSGVCQTDYSGYPDCRNETITSLEKAINLGMEKKYLFHTPLMWKNKSAIWEMAFKLGGKEYLNLIRINTHTCYEGDRKNLHVWGYGCNKCPACKLRSNGWYNFIKEKKVNEKI